MKNRFKKRLLLKRLALPLQLSWEITNCVRLKPSSIVMGETGDNEAASLLKIMNSGHPGSLEWKQTS